MRTFQKSQCKLPVISGIYTVDRYCSFRHLDSLQFLVGIECSSNSWLLGTEAWIEKERAHNLDPTRCYIERIDHASIATMRYNGQGHVAVRFMHIPNDRCFG